MDNKLLYIQRWFYVDILRVQYTGCLDFLMAMQGTCVFLFYENCVFFFCKIALVKDNNVLLILIMSLLLYNVFIIVQGDLVLLQVNCF